MLKFRGVLTADDAENADENDQTRFFLSASSASSAVNCVGHLRTPLLTCGLLHCGLHLGADLHPDLVVFPLGRSVWFLDVVGAEFEIAGG